MQDYAVRYEIISLTSGPHGEEYEKLSHAAL